MVKSIMMLSVRTTITLEDSLAAKVRVRARKQNLSFKQVINEAVRSWLQTPAQQPKLKKFRVVPIMNSSFRPGIDVDKINQFLDDEEIDYYAAKMKQGK